MKLTTKGRYAVTAMLDLAIYGDERPVALADIARRQDISLSYLEQLFAKLRNRGLVTSTRGPGGGYALSRDPHGIAVADIIGAVDEGVHAALCSGQFDCSEQRHCLAHDLWASLSERIHIFFENISLGELKRRQRVREVARRQRDTGSAEPHQHHVAMEP